MSTTTLGFIGGGNMNGAIIGGLLGSGVAADNILISDPSETQRQALEERFNGSRVTASNGPVAANADVLVLGVKPQLLKAVCEEIREEAQARRPLVISVAAGVRVDDIDGWLGGGLAVVRCMPNQPALLRRGITGLYANARCGEAELDRARDILAAVGDVVVVSEETDIDTVTAVAGSGPAYVYLLMAMLEDYARHNGLDGRTARRLAVQTTAGSAAMALASDEALDTLIARVRSPGGTTAAALDSLDAGGVRDIFGAALDAARTRAAELADQASEPT